VERLVLERLLDALALGDLTMCDDDAAIR